MPSITPVLRTQKKNKRGLCPVYLRVADSNESRFHALGLAVKETDWNARTASVRKSHPEHETLNAAVSRAVADAELALVRRRAEGERPSAAEIKEAIAPSRSAKRSRDFWEFADSFVDGYKDRGQIWSYDRFRSVFKKFRLYTGEPLSFDALTPALLRQYENHLIAKYENKVNTVATAMKAIRTVVRRAVAEGHIEFSGDPFHQHRLKHEQTERIRLTIEEVEAVESLDLRAGSIEAIARDCWVFAFYTGGPRIGDVLQTQWRSVAGGRHEYRMTKNKKHGVLDLVHRAQAVLSRYAPPDAKPDPDAYVFPLLPGRDLSTPELKKRALQSDTARINRALKEVARAAGVEKNLTSHVARHSWADFARRSGWDVYSISKVLRHSNLRVTERYLATFDEEALSHKMHGLFPDATEPLTHADHGPGPVHERMRTALVRRRAARRASRFTSASDDEPATDD